MQNSAIAVLVLAGVVAGTTAALRPVDPRGPGAPAPELTNMSWLNSDQPLRLSELRGRVVLLNFWVFTCGNCTRTVPSLVAYDRQYRERGLTIIGIHTPEFPPYAGEHDKSNVARALSRQGITYPNAQDNDRRTWDAYDIRSISTTGISGNGTGTSGSCLPNEANHDSARDGRRLSELPPARGHPARAAAPPRGRARSADQRPLEAGARAGRRDDRALRLAPPDVRLGLFCGGADGRSARRCASRHPPSERLSVWRRNLPVAGDRRGVVRCTP